MLQAELPPKLLPPRLMLLLPPPLPAWAVWSCTQCCWEGVGGLKELRICKQYRTPQQFECANPVASAFLPLCELHPASLLSRRVMT